MKINIPLFLTLPRLKQQAVIEALIFASGPDESLTAKSIYNIVLLTENIQSQKKYSANFSKLPSAINNELERLSSANNLENNEQDEQTEINSAQKALDKIAQDAGFSIEEIEKIIDEINDDLDNSNRPYRIVQYAGCYQFATLQQYGEIVQRMLRSKTKKNFTTAQLETLSIIAYKQPVTKHEIDRIRGVMSSSEIINVLIEKELIQIAGRKDVIGKPLLYSTTSDFLRTFGLNELSDLPKLREIDEIAEQKLLDEDERTEMVLNITEEDVARMGESEIFKIIENGNENETEINIEENNSMNNK
jgi:segregation and condensation protein B